MNPSDPKENQFGMSRTIPLNPDCMSCRTFRTIPPAMPAPAAAMTPGLIPSRASSPPPVPAAAPPASPPPAPPASPPPAIAARISAAAAAPPVANAARISVAAAAPPPMLSAPPVRSFAAVPASWTPTLITPVLDSSSRAPRVSCTDLGRVATNPKKSVRAFSSSCPAPARPGASFPINVARFFSRSPSVFPLACTYSRNEPTSARADLDADQRANAPPHWSR